MKMKKSPSVEGLFFAACLFADCVVNHLRGILTRECIIRLCSYTSQKTFCICQLQGVFLPLCTGQTILLYIVTAVYQQHFRRFNRSYGGIRRENRTRFAGDDAIGVTVFNVAACPVVIYVVKIVLDLPETMPYA